MKLRLPMITFFFLSSFFVYYTYSQTIQIEPTLTAVNEEEETPCTETQTLLQEKISDFKLRNNQNSFAYQVLLIKLNYLSAKAKILGYDTTALDQNILNLKTLIANFDKNAKLLVQKLEAAQLNVCSQLQAQAYGKSVAESRKALKDLISDTTKIENFFDTEIAGSVANLSALEVEQ